MGGNAFDKAERMTADEYANFVCVLHNSEEFRMSNAYYWTIPASVHEKESYGDVDILTYEAERVYQHLKDDLEVIDEIKNPSGYNLLVKTWFGKTIQVDINKVKVDDFNFANEYFSWNDLGNLIGRIAHRQGLKFGHDGLWYIHRKGDRVLREILITTTYHRALDYLGFDSSAYRRGFLTFDEMFTWVETSKYFEPCAFPLEHRNHQARMRDSKRKTYQAFLRRINFTGEYVESDKAAWLEKHRAEWPELDKAIKEADAEDALNEQAKEKLNGKLVGEWTGFSGKELGALMQIVKRIMPRDFVLSSSQATIERGILFALAIYEDEKK